MAFIFIFIVAVIIRKYSVMSSVLLYFFLGFLRKKNIFLGWLMLDVLVIMTWLILKRDWFMTILLLASSLVLYDFNFSLWWSFCITSEGTFYSLQLIIDTSWHGIWLESSQLYFFRSSKRMWQLGSKGIMHCGDYVFMH